MDIREYLKNNILLMDGAMETYFDALGESEEELAESANFTNPELIQNIHNSYIEKGAQLIRTNTFAVNHVFFHSEDRMKQCIQLGYEIAKKAVEQSKKDVWIGASIGPIPEDGELEDRESILKEYEFLCDCFLEMGCKIFIFETFTVVEDVAHIAKYLKEKDETLFVMGNFHFNKMGYTKEGLSIQRFIDMAGNIEELDAYGFNCGIGAGHLYELLKSVTFPNEKYVSCVPNSGYPYQIRGKKIYSDSPVYYTECMKKVVKLGANIIGACCGSRPSYIEKLKEGIPLDQVYEKKVCKREVSLPKHKKDWANPFMAKLNRGKKVIAVELDPPFNQDAKKLLQGAKLLSEEGVDMVTLADSPLARARADSIQMAIRIQNETGLHVMPHICCRDKNKIAMRSQMIGAYINGIRNLLIVTGDPIDRGDEDSIKRVYNFNSIRLMDYVSDMNVELFGEEPVVYGGALNYAGANVNAIVDRMRKKIEAGCQYFLTQPVYSKEDMERIRFLKENVDTKILCGIMPLVSYKNARFIRNEMPGIHVPDDIFEQYRPDMTREEAEEIAVKVSVSIAMKMKDITDGYYFMTPFNRVSLITKILRRLKEELGEE